MEKRIIKQIENGFETTLERSALIEGGFATEEEKARYFYYMGYLDALFCINEKLDEVKNERVF